MKLTISHSVAACSLSPDQEEIVPVAVWLEHVAGGTAYVAVIAVVIHIEVFAARSFERALSDELAYPEQIASAVVTAVPWSAIPTGLQAGVLIQKPASTTTARGTTLPRWAASSPPIPLVFGGDAGSFGNSYAYGGNSPLIYTDPFGLEIRENLVASFSELRDIMTRELNLLKLENNKDSIDADNFLEHLATNNFETYNVSSKGRFVYTNEKGFLDMKHVLKAAEAVRNFYISSGMVLAHGERIEAKQAENRSPSGWGVEDLPSDLAGVEFAEKGFETGEEVIVHL